MTFHKIYARPLLFNMLINDFKKHISGEVMKFENMNLFRVLKLSD